MARPTIKPNLALASATFATRLDTRTTTLRRHAVCTNAARHVHNRSLNP